MKPLILIANPGSASRKYAIYAGDDCLARLHFEYQGEQVMYSVEQNGERTKPQPARIAHINFVASKLETVCRSLSLFASVDQIKCFALRIVAPSSDFQVDRVLNQKAVSLLQTLEHRAPLHISATLNELKLLETYFPKAYPLGISDSAFHVTMSDVNQHYGLPHDIAKKLDMKRFGYHGLSVESVVLALKAAKLLPPRLVVCHLGSGVSITAVKNGKSLDTSMGYSPLEGVVMATRSGNLDVSAALNLKHALKLSDDQLIELLNHKSGLLGVSGISADLRDLLQAEHAGQDKAQAALQLYITRIQQTVGHMAASLGGLDGLIFTGIVGERNAEIRRRITAGLLWLGVSLNPRRNHQTIEQDELVRLSQGRHPVKVYVAPAQEDDMIIRKVKLLQPDLF